MADNDKPKGEKRPPAEGKGDGKGQAKGAQQGKANGPLVMDTFPYTGIVMTHSLNSIVTDSAPGAACYSTGNKNNNNQEGVFPDDTIDAFDNPRMDYAGEYLRYRDGIDCDPGAVGGAGQGPGLGGTHGDGGPEDRR